MKALLSLAVLLLFSLELTAGPITKHEQKRIESFPVPSLTETTLSESPLIPATAEKETRLLPHCNWVSVDGESCVSLSRLSVPPSPPSATPEPASVLLFGTLLLGAIGVAKFKG